MKQILFIHGGTLAKDNQELLETMSKWDINPFKERKRRRDTLYKHFPDFTFIKPDMPNKELANYALWKMWFEKHIPFLDPEELIIIGHSLGGMFLTKYFAENSFPLPVAQLHLVAPVLDQEGLNEGDNYLWDFAYAEQDIAKIAGKAQHICVWASKDDDSVPYTHGVRIHQQIAGAELFLFEDKGHFRQEEFPELVTTIRKYQKK